MVSTFRAKHDIDQTFAHLARCLVIVLLWPVIANAEEAQRPDDDALAKSIVEKADQVRFPREGFEVVITINTTGTDESADTRKYRVLSKGNENTVVMVTACGSTSPLLIVLATAVPARAPARFDLSND